MRLKHPHIKPDLYIEVPEDKVVAYLAAGWLRDEPEAPEVPEEETPAPVRRVRRAHNEQEN